MSSNLQATTNAGRRRKRGRRAAIFIIAAFPFILWSCFPGPLRELWPPRTGEARHTIDVLFHDWHTIIVEPVTAPAAGYREWEFCEKGWFLEGRQGCSGLARSLFWPTASGVGCKYSDEPQWRLYPAEEAERWTFILSDKGLEAMDAYLEAEKGEPLAEFPGWFAGNSSYHLFYDCHHFTASALRAAGLPIRPWWAFCGWQIGVQLHRVRRFHEEEIP